MLYREQNGNTEYVYDVTFSEEEMNSLLNTIVRSGSYKEIGTFSIDYGGSNVKKNKDGSEEITGLSLINGDPQYVDVRNINYYKYEHPGDSIRINGTKVISPKLANIIESMLCNQQSGLYDFISYPNSEELVPIDEQITSLNSSIKEMDDFDIDTKIDALTKLKSLVYRKQNNQYFNPDLLKSFYERAKSLITFTLVRTIISSDSPAYSFDQLFSQKEDTLGTTKGK